jgi:hypothetical protein
MPDNTPACREICHRIIPKPKEENMSISLAALAVPTPDAPEAREAYVPSGPPQVKVRAKAVRAALQDPADTAALPPRDKAVSQLDIVNLEDA